MGGRKVAAPTSLHPRLLKSDNFHKISCTRAETVYNIQ